MNLVDSSGWLEYFAEGTNADFFAPLIEDTDHLIVPTICILEVFKKVLGQRGEDMALQTSALMQQGEVVNLDRMLAMDAAAIGLKEKLPLADSVILATARHRNATLWTQDADFKGLQNVQYIAKRSS